MAPVLLHQRRSEGVKLEKFSPDGVHLSKQGLELVDLQNFLVRALLSILISKINCHVCTLLG